MKTKIIAILTTLIVLIGGGTAILGGSGGGTVHVVRMSSTALTDVSSTTSVSFEVEDAVQVDMNLRATSSDVSAVVTWKNYFSYDNSTWYGEDDFTDTSAVVDTHGATVLVHKWTPASTSTSLLKNVKNLNVSSKYMKIEFGNDTATSTIEAEIIIKQQID